METPIVPPIICPHCQNLVPAGSIFCPRCGKALKDPPLSSSLSKQAIIYLVSFFLTPLGLYWAIKYIRSSDDTNRRIGIISVILTVLGIIINLYLAAGIVSGILSQIFSLNSGF